ncbi:MAG: OmpA family protein [Pyrinomonadaceae bacterium]|nr:OmpA family protein [Pyrinomonadaceae bacterium]MBP6211452.1 OmpA family protein [Pyrinomonadaceae bacterium]
MSEDNKFPPPPPPDDFSKTTPNIRLPENDSPDADWDKTNYNYPKQPAPDEWGKTVTNIRPIDTGGDFDKTFYPGSKAPSTPDWGMTEANVNINPADLGTRPEDFGGGQAYDKTTPYFQLPDAERAKYQSLPPTPAEQAAQVAEEEKQKGGVPVWAWVGGALGAVFLFAIVVLGVAWFLISRDASFEVTVKNAPPGSSILIDNAPIGVTDESGSRRLQNLRAGDREIKVVHPSFECPVRRVVGKDGEILPAVDAGCTAIVAKSTDDCGNIRFGEDDKAERCYNSALDALPDPFTAEDLIKALNILIINFESGKYDVPPVRLAALQKGAIFIKKLPQGIVLEVGGHTDNVGQPASNQTLSEARANAVKAVLVKFGVADSTLQTRGYGAAKPITTNDTVDGKYRNRRIEYSIVRK